jgi:hypothetical protein
VVFGPPGFRPGFFGEFDRRYLMDRTNSSNRINSSIAQFNYPQFSQVSISFVTVLTRKNSSLLNIKVAMLEVVTIVRIGTIQPRNDLRDPDFQISQMTHTPMTR